MELLYDLTSDFKFVPKGKKKEDEFQYLTDLWESTLPPLPSENIGSPITSGVSESPLPWQEAMVADPYAGLLPDENTWGGALPDQSFADSLTPGQTLITDDQKPLPYGVLPDWNMDQVDETVGPGPSESPLPWQEGMAYDPYAGLFPDENTWGGGPVLPEQLGFSFADQPGFSNQGLSWETPEQQAQRELEVPNWRPVGGDNAIPQSQVAGGPLGLWWEPANVSDRTQREQFQQWSELPPEEEQSKGWWGKTKDWVTEPPEGGWMPQEGSFLGTATNAGAKNFEGITGHETTDVPGGAVGEAVAASIFDPLTYAAFGVNVPLGVGAKTAKALGIAGTALGAERSPVARLGTELAINAGSRAASTEAGARLPEDIPFVPSEYDAKVRAGLVVGSGFVGGGGAAAGAGLVNAAGPAIGRGVKVSIDDITKLDTKINEPAGAMGPVSAGMSVSKKPKGNPLDSLPEELHGPLLAAVDESGMTPEQVGAAVRNDPEAFRAVADEITTVYHGSNGPLEGDIRAGLNVTPNPDDAMSYARATTGLSGGDPTVTAFDVTDSKALKPMAPEEGLAAARGGMVVTDPSGIRPRPVTPEPTAGVVPLSDLPGGSLAKMSLEDVISSAEINNPIESYIPLKALSPAVRKRALKELASEGAGPVLAEGSTLSKGTTYLTGRTDRYGTPERVSAILVPGKDSPYYKPFTGNVEAPPARAEPRVSGAKAKAAVEEPALPDRIAALDEKVTSGTATPAEAAVVSSVKKRAKATTKAGVAEADKEVVDDLARVIMEDASSGEPPKPPPRVTGKSPQEPEGGKPPPPEDDARRYLREQREQRDAGVVDALKKRNQGRQFGVQRDRFKEGYENGLRGEELSAYASKGTEGGLGETGLVPLSDEGLAYVREQVQEAYRAGTIDDAQWKEAQAGIRQSVGNGWIEPKQRDLLASIVGEDIANSMAARDLSGVGLGTAARPIPRREGVDDLELRPQPRMDEPSATATYESQIAQERAVYREWVANQRPAASQPSTRSILDANKNPEATAGQGDTAGAARLAHQAALAEGASKRDAERFAAWVAEKRAQPPREGADQLSFGDEALYGTPVVNPSGIRVTGEPTYTELRDSWRSAARAANEAELAARSPGADELAKTRAVRARRGANEAKAALDRATPESRATHRAALDAAAAEPTPESIERAARSFGFKIVRTGYTVTIETLLGSKAIKASLDLSAMLRQGVLVGGAHPKIAMKAFGKQLEGWKSKQGYDDLMENLANSHNASWHEDGGLAVTDTLTKSEEQFTGHFVEKLNLHNLPGVAGKVGAKISEARIGPVPIGKALDLGDAVAASSRAYSALLNYMRVHVFDTVWDNLPDNAKTTERAKALSGLINASTGRGVLPARLGSNNKILNTIFFAPRYVVSRPEFVYRAGKLAVTDKYLRGEALKQLTGYFAATGTLMALGVAAYEASDGKAGWQVDMNPKSGNFGNMKIGPVSFDPWGGFSQIAKLAIQASTAEKYSGNSGTNRDLSRFLKYGPAKEPVGRFVRGKLSPVASLYTSLQSGRDFDGNKISTNPIGLLSDLAEPLSFSEMRKSWLEYDLKTALMTVPGYLGMGVNVQPKDNYEIASKAAYEEFNPERDTGVSYEKPKRAYWDPLFKRLFNEKNPDIEPEVKGERAEKSKNLIKEYEVKQAENTRQFAAGEIDVGNWKDWRSTLSYAKVQEREQILGEFVGADPPKDTPAYWVKTYTDTFVRLPDDKLDRDATQAKQNEWVKEYGADALAYVNAFYAADKTPEDKAYIKAMQKISGDGYFDRSPEGMPHYRGLSDGADEEELERLVEFVGYERNKTDTTKRLYEDMDWGKSAMKILLKEGYTASHAQDVVRVHNAQNAMETRASGGNMNKDGAIYVDWKYYGYKQAHPKELAWLNDNLTYDQILEIYDGSFETD